MLQFDNCLFVSYLAITKYNAMVPVAFHITLSYGSLI